MAWWWKSDESSDTAKASEATTKAAPADDIRAPPAKTSETLPAAEPPASREQQAYNELKDLFTQLNPEAASSAAARAKAYAESKPDFDDDSLYPSTMSCSQCFDLAYYCSSVGGQANNIYRYGGLRSCSELWAQWRFCMRTKAMNKDTAAIEIRKWNQQKVAKYKTGKSSEDVWNTRRTLPAEPFTENPDEYVSQY